MAITHAPLLIIVDVPGTPRLRIITRCLPCGVTVTDRKIDASEIKEIDAGHFGSAWGEGDGEAWLAHAGTDGPAEAFAEIAGEALEQARDAIRRDYFPKTWALHADAVNCALGAFSGAVLRLLKGDTAEPKPERKPS